MEVWELDEDQLDQVQGGAMLALQTTAIRQLTVTDMSTQVPNAIGNIAICSGCHGCTHVGFVPDPGIRY